MKKAAINRHERRLRPRHLSDRPAVVLFGDRLLLEIGSVHMFLDRKTAETLMCDLANALEPGDPLGIGIGSN
jgi:hypothetical protein